MKKQTLFMLCVLLSGLVYAQSINVSLQPFATGLSSPVDIAHAGDDRLFVVEQGGRIKIVQDDGTVNTTPFLDISSQVSNGSEQGLLGLAFHPDYATNGYFFVSYTDNSGDSQVSRFSVSGDPDVADGASELEIIDSNQPFPNHNGGSLNFGPDGMLYISWGDGGSGGDPGNRAQNTTLLLGKLLRIDIDNTDPGLNYAIPSDNPFAGSATDAEEIWAYGLRNAWKFTFDSDNGDIWIGDVGQENVEEIDRAPYTDAGLNYGWRCYEGNDPFNTSNCPPDNELTFPIGVYSSSNATPHCSITGGYVYRGSDYPDMQGIYFFADVCSGMIGGIENIGATNDVVDYGTFGGSWVSFGENMNNELFIANISGSISRVTGETVLGVNDLKALNISIAPNPVTNRLSVISNNNIPFEITIQDMKGSILHTERHTGQTPLNLDTSSFASGLYLAKITSEQGSAVQKIVKQ
ncbi:PQQ-dependent sugar dehydrogenase [Aureisphaera galaxeae]|uniref:PQQ-dependent sugar dehydrogenase n=1 Tax=Aureisphaera galaxeae TaxID=1538023 RepID=UPI0023508772|nr:PQQ-dependent sugar dehydrogenase [Aureisphaera galaxeae]MDC8004987.1 PQQ-dependent sugar dehydrogenase [Aureisphaera galaxeae]